jgi:hypothetical protein
MFRRVLLFMTMALASSALAVAPAFAGEDPDPSPAPVPAPAPLPAPVPNTPAPNAPAPGAPATPTAKMESSRSCASTNHAKATVSGTSIASVSFLVDGKRVSTRTSSSGGAFPFSMSCSRLGFGVHRAKAVVTFTNGTHRTLPFRIVRTRPARAQFTG